MQKTLKWLAIGVAVLGVCVVMADTEARVLSHAEANAVLGAATKCKCSNLCVSFGNCSGTESCSAPGTKCGNVKGDDSAYKCVDGSTFDNMECGGSQNCNSYSCNCESQGERGLTCVKDASTSETKGEWCRVA